MYIFKFNGTQIDRIGLLLVVALILAIGNTFAENEGPVSIVAPIAGEAADPESAITYWTPERMQEAVPMPFPEVVSPVPGGVEEENSLEPEIPLDNSPSFTPGSEPGNDPLQSDPESYLEPSPADSQEGVSIEEQPENSLAENGGPPSIAAPPNPNNEEILDSTTTYWTPERMEGAVPIPIPEVVVLESQDLPSDAPPPNPEQPSEANSSEKPNNDFLQLSSATEEIAPEEVPSANNDSTTTDRVTQPVLCDTQLPPLETYAFNSQGESLETQTRISGGVAVNQGDFQRQVTQQLSDSVEVVSHICANPQHLGQLAKLVVYATYQPLTSSTNAIQHYMLNTDSQIVEWDGELAHGVAFREVVLEESQSISIYQGQFPAPGLLNIYFGYWLPVIDRFVFNREAIEVKILN